MVLWRNKKARSWTFPSTTRQQSRLIPNSKER